MLWKDQIREWKDEAREDGLAEGRKEGANSKAIETAKKMLENELSTDLITKYTGLSLDEVNALDQKKSS